MPALHAQQQFASDRGGSSVIANHPAQTEGSPAPSIEHWRRFPPLCNAPCDFNGKLLAPYVAIATAHPDDETIGCGAFLCATSASTVIVVTDGSPRNPADAARLGFASADAYAQARFAELRMALQIAGISDGQLIALGVRDQDAALQIIPLARRLAQIFTSFNSHIVLTHAYEGGHPDHDATALAVHLAAKRLAKGGHELEIYEMPFYRLDGDQPVYQSFAPGAAPAITILLGPKERERKHRMMQSFVTQKSVLAPIGIDAERFRSALHDFSELPNGGKLLYERHDWAMTGERWLSLARDAMAS
jgi:LmbE family N-acetylglucosaminyl deacetylase